MFQKVYPLTPLRSFYIRTYINMYLRKFTNVHVQISQIHALVITHLYASLYRSYHATLTKHDYPLMIIINT